MSKAISQYKVPDPPAEEKVVVKPLALPKGSQAKPKNRPNKAARARIAKRRKAEIQMPYAMRRELKEKARADRVSKGKVPMEQVPMGRKSDPVEQKPLIEIKRLRRQNENPNNLPMGLWLAYNWDRINCDQYPIRVRNYVRIACRCFSKAITLAISLVKIIKKDLHIPLRPLAFIGYGLKRYTSPPVGWRNFLLGKEPRWFNPEKRDCINSRSK